MFTRKCANCGGVFTTSRRNYFYCCYACYQAKALKPRVCHNCGKEYVGPSWKLFCSGECRGRQTISSSIKDLADELLEGREPDVEKCVTRFLFVPELVALTIFHMTCQGARERFPYENPIDGIMKSNVVRYLAEVPDCMNLYMRATRQLVEHTRHLAFVPSELSSAFRADAGTSLRSLILASPSTISGAIEPSSTRLFITGLRLIESLTSLIPVRGFRRCISCHVVGNASHHFRRIKIRDTWGFDELCIYCQPKDWYADLRGN